MSTLSTIILLYLPTLFSGAKKSDAEVQWHSLKPLEGVTDIRQFDHWLASRNAIQK